MSYDFTETRRKTSYSLVGGKALLCLDEVEGAVGNGLEDRCTVYFKSGTRMEAPVSVIAVWDAVAAMCKANEK